MVDRTDGGALDSAGKVRTESEIEHLEWFVWSLELVRIFGSEA